jgi:hypothetical protein
MISRNNRINSFLKLGLYLTNPQNSLKLEEMAVRANRKNNWFTIENTLNSLQAIGEKFLDEEKLSHWTNQYREPASSKKIGVIMAGNIPAVGFHDALCVLISGHTLMAKLSTDDAVLVPELLDLLIEIEPAFKEYIQFVERLNQADAYIGTGSNNTARYFHYYFAKKPNIIRKNRNSVAILTGSESTQDLFDLGKDILQYFGLGCRNVSHLFVPEGYDFTKFYEAIQPIDATYLNHYKYFNNYEYNKSVLLINRTLHYDNGYLMMTEHDALVSPISVIYYQTYQQLDAVKEQLQNEAEKIQCVVGKDIAVDNLIPFGKSQQPELTDYADGVDTMKFLESL